MRIAAVVLAAGESRRLGEPKQLVMLGDETLLERALRIGRESGCDPILVVLGASAELIRARCGLGKSIVVVNEEWAEGMGASVRAGVRALGSDVDGCVVMTCDMPAVSPEHLRSLMRAGEVTASEYAGRRGVPAYFPRTMFGQLMESGGDAGARELLRAASAIELKDGEVDIDTAADLERAREKFTAAFQPRGREGGQGS